MRLAVKVVPLGALGFAVALLVACGNGNGLLSGSQAGSLQDALSAAQSACSGGDAARAALAAQRFSNRVDALPPSVDAGLRENLQQGASTLDSLVSRTCTGTTATTTTPTTVTTTTIPPTTATTTTPTTTTAPTTPTTTTPTEPPPPTTPDNGGQPPRGGDGQGDSGGAPGSPGGAPPGQLKKHGGDG